jgi:ribonuclease R
MHRRGDAHVLGETGSGDVHVAASQLGMALNGDRVAVEPAQEMRRGDRRDRPDPAPKADSESKEWRVVKIVERAKQPIVGVLHKHEGRWSVIPDDPRLPRDVFVKPEGPVPFTAGDKVVAELDYGASKPDFWRGRVLEILGPEHAPGVDMLGIIRRYNLPETFPAPVIEEAERIEEAISADEIAQREDLRGMFIVTIDPDDAKDFDDAIHVEKTRDGWRLGVHIADVSHYVRPGTELDREALDRGNSVYLADRVIPMLPEALSNGICSLKPKVERLVSSVFMDFDKSGNPGRARFAKSVIRSAARLTYRQALAILENRTPPPTPNYERGGSVHLDAKPTLLEVTPELKERVQTAWELAAILRKKRFAAGSLDLDFPEVKIWLDGQGHAVRLERMENDISHQLVEEFMLAANEAVAKEIKYQKRPCIYRVHDNPDPDKLAEFRQTAIAHGYKCGDLTKRPEVQKLLAGIKGNPEEHVIKTGFLRSLKRAVYDLQPLGHYGLAKVNYTHFTSPIRRYADLVVHRILFSSAKKHVNPAAKALPFVAQHISTTERVAADAERDSTKLKKLEFFLNQLQSKQPEVFRAIIVEARHFGLIVDLPDCQQGGVVHVSNLNDDYYQFDNVRQRFVGQRHRKVYKMGDAIEVMVSRVDLEKQDVDFCLAGEPEIAPARPAKPAKSSPPLTRNEPRKKSRRRR